MNDFNTISPADLAAWEAVIANATPGPWVIDPFSDDETIAIHCPQKDRHVCILESRVKASEEQRREPDAAFIALARDALPRLIAAYRAACERVRELEAK